MEEAGNMVGRAKPTPGSAARRSIQSGGYSRVWLGRISRNTGSWTSRSRSVATVPCLRPCRISSGATTAATAIARHRVRTHSWRRSATARAGYQPQDPGVHAGAQTASTRSGEAAPRVQP